MTTITQVIAGLTDPPDPATDIGDGYSDKAAITMTELKTMGDEINTWTGQANTVAGEVNTNATTATTKASEASASAAASLASAAVALGAANCVGAWSSLTGAKTVPLSVEHDGVIWILTANTSDVTADEPGVSAKWARAYGGGIIYPRTSNIEFVAEDNGKIFEYTSGTFSQTFDAAATLKEGWSVSLKNSGTGVITLDPDSSELINGAATVTLYQGDIAVVICSGTGFDAWITRATGPVLLSTATASNSASISFTGLSSIYDKYELQFINVKPQTDTANLVLRTSTNGGSSYDSGASDYAYAVSDFSTAGSSVGPYSAGATGIPLANSVGNDTNENGVSGNLSIFTPSDAIYTSVYFSTVFRASNGVLYVGNGSGQRMAAADVDAIQLLFSSGNITSGKFKLYGWRAN